MKFFYELHENNLFNKDAYNQLIIDIKLYKEEIEKKQFIDKSVVNLLFMGINIFSGIEEMNRGGTVKVKGFSKGGDLNNYYNELIAEIGLLLN